jgi:dihydroflavonol-4-reductase
MERVYLVTGAAGHVGSALMRALSRKDGALRGLILPGEKPTYQTGVQYFTGDVTKPSSLADFFGELENKEAILFHTAGIVDLSSQVTPAMEQVNIEGTRNIIEMCRRYGIKRMVYFSSVHAIPEQPPLTVVEESNRFSPEQVTGGYAKTKAAATKLVLEAAKEGTDIVVVHPSGIIGPYDGVHNHLIQLIHQYLSGKLPAYIKGGYDFVDVRDVAEGAILAAEKGKPGQCYILSNQTYQIGELLEILRKLTGKRRIPRLPTWMAEVSLPFIQAIAKLRKKRPLYTKYSLFTLQTKQRFSHDKATRELGYHPRDLVTTLKDTVSWLQPQLVKERIKQKKQKPLLAGN